jgi:AraC family transcriptional activator of pyochelin receptor
MVSPNTPVMSYNKITYTVPLSSDEYSDNIEAIITHYAEVFSSKTLRDVPFEEEFLGLDFNLFGEYKYTVNDQPTTSVTTSTFNLIYIPRGTHIKYLMNKGKHSSLSVRYPLAFLQFWCETHPHLSSFLEKTMHNRMATALPWYYPLSGDIYDIIIKILNDRNPPELRNVSLRAKLYDIVPPCLIRIYSALRERAASSDEQKISAVHDYISQNVQYMLTKDILAEKFHIDSRKLMEGFKRLYNNTIINHLIEERLKKAKSLLRDTTMTLREISEAVGYKHQQHFSDIFRKKFGMSPGEYRRDGY